MLCLCVSFFLNKLKLTRHGYNEKFEIFVKKNYCIHPNALQWKKKMLLNNLISNFTLAIKKTKLKIRWRHETFFKRLLWWTDFKLEEFFESHTSPLTIHNWKNGHHVCSDNDCSLMFTFLNHAHDDDDDYWDKYKILIIKCVISLPTIFIQLMNKKNCVKFLPSSWI